MFDFRKYDLNSTIKSFDFTKQAYANMNAIINSDDFEDIEDEKIFEYFHEDFRPVPFGEHLKRYIYKNTHITAPYNLVPDDTYVDIILQSYNYNNAPVSIQNPYDKIKKTRIKSWLTTDVKRITVFSLGFGLKMKPSDIRDFLIKGIKSEDFDFYDPIETIYWYCFSQGLTFADYMSLKQEYEKTEESFFDETAYNTILSDPENLLTSKSNLLKYLAGLKIKKPVNDYQKDAYCEFFKLHKQAKIEAAKEKNNEPDVGKGQPKAVTPEEITKVDIINMLYTAPDPYKELKKSDLDILFRANKLTRQRLHFLLNKTYPVKRFDILTLLFFVCANKYADIDKRQRFNLFIDEANETLHKCHMYGIYPANPYESFLIMCMFSEAPILVFSEVLDRPNE